MGPLGCLAAYIDSSDTTFAKFDQVGCSIHVNKVVQYYNGKLKETVVQLRKEFPFAAITYVDIYTAKYTLFSQANEHGMYVLASQIAVLNNINLFTHIGIC